MMGMGDMGEEPGDAEGAAELGGPMGSADEPFEPKDEEEREIVAFMDDSQPMASRVLALQEAIRLCVEKHGSGGYSGSSSAEKKPPPALAMIFGGKEKKG